MIAGSGFDALAGRKRIPPRVTPEPGRLTSYRPGELTLATSVSGDVHPITAQIKNSIASVLRIDRKSYDQTVYAGDREVIKEPVQLVSAQTGG
jgi:hypothetical protein